MKRLLLVLVVVAGLIGIGYFALHHYLRSANVAGQVATKLENYYGGDVEVGTVDIGLSGSTIQDLKLYEKKKETPAKNETSAEPKRPWLDVKSLRTDVSLMALIRGVAIPTELTLDAPTVRLRFDHEGNLLTHFPLPGGKETSAEGFDLSQVPSAAIQHGTLVFSKAGYADLVVTDVDARLTRDGERLKLDGTGTSAEFGKLILTGSYDPRADKVQVELKTEGVAHVTRDDLHRIPFIPKIVWDEVDVQEGTTPAHLSASYDLKTRAFHYRADLAPRHTTLYIPEVRLPAEDASGKVIVDDNVVTLQGVEGKAFGGTIRLEAVGDFRGPIDQMKFTHVKIQGADLARLPESWRKKIPPQIRGMLTATLAMEIDLVPRPIQPEAVGSLVGAAGTPGLRTLPGATVAAMAPPPLELKVTGHGKGKIVGATVAGFPAEITLRWVPGAGFQPEDDKGARLDDAGKPWLALLAAQTPVVYQAPDSAPAVNELLGQGVHETLQGLRRFSRGVIDTGTELFDRLPRTIDTTPKKPGAAPSYFEVNLKLKKVSLSQLVKNLGVNVPYAVDGTLSFQVKASFPTDAPGDLKAYKFHGTAQVTDLTVEGLRIPQADADVVYEQGVLTLTSLKGRFAPSGKEAPGAFQGGARFQVVPLGPLSADLALDRAPLGQLVALAVKDIPVAGALSGKVSARAPGDKLKDAKAWAAVGTFTSDRVDALGLGIEKANLIARVENGELKVTNLQGLLEGAPLGAVGRVTLAGRYPFQANVTLRDWDVATLKRLSPQFRPPIALAGRFSTSVDVSGTLRPLEVKAAGDARASDLVLDKFAVKDARFHWEATNDRLLVKELNAQLYSGAVAGSAVLPLNARTPGKIDLKVKNLDAHELAKAFPVPFKIEGHVDGALTGTLPPAAAGKERSAKMNLAITAPKLRVQNVPTEQLQGTLEYQQGLVDYKLEGKSLGGTFELEGQVPVGTQPAAKPVPTREGRLSIRNARLGRLFEALKMGEAQSFGGLLNLEMKYRTGAGGLPDGAGVIGITNVRWGRHRLGNNLRGDITLDNGIARLRNLTAEIAGGMLRAQVVYSVKSAERSFFHIALDNVEAAQILSPWLDDHVTGPLRVRIRGHLGVDWAGTAEFDLVRGTVYGVDVTDWRLPMTWRLSPGQNRGEIRVTDTTAHVSRGRASGKLNLQWDYAARVDGDVKFNGVDVQSLLRGAGGSSLIGGHMSGRFVFAGNNVRSFDDLTGTLDASFKQAQALQVPVLRQVAPFLGVGPSTTFQNGRLIARLSRGGVIRVQQLNLQGGNLQVFADGTVLTSGRLNLDVVAKTGEYGLPLNRLRLFGLRIPLAGPVPLVVLQEASALLSNRLIYLTVTGTYHNPVIRPRPVPILTETALRFFMDRTLPINPFEP
jgi:hypothetical protein